MRRVLTVSLCLLALAGCGRKDEQKPQAPSSAAFEAQEQQGQQQQSSGSLFSSCPPLPLKSAVESGLKSAMSAIYGPDEGAMRFSVSAMAPGSDCKSVTVNYKAGGSAATAPMRYDDGKWSLTLYNKQYPVP